MRIKFFGVIAVFSALLFTLSNCFSAWEGDLAAITLYTGGAGNGRYIVPSDEIEDELEYTAELKGPSNITLYGSGKTKITGQVIPGSYIITIEAKLEGKLYAAGSAAADVKAGQSNLITITINQINWVYTVNFESNDGSPVEPVYLDESGRIDEPAQPTKYRYVFDGWYTDRDLKTEWNFSNDFVTADTTLYAKWRNYKIGDTGPAGGIIFYVDLAGFTVYTSEGGITFDYDYLCTSVVSTAEITCYYLEAASVGLDSTHRWWDTNNYISPIISNDDAIGYGRQNTEKIIATDLYCFNDPTVPSMYNSKTCILAAEYCKSFNQGGYIDWFLPSSEELKLMHNYLYKELGVFTDGIYWSSSAKDYISSAKAMVFGDDYDDHRDGDMIEYTSSLEGVITRPIRAF